MSQKPGAPGLAEFGVILSLIAIFSTLALVLGQNEVSQILSQISVQLPNPR